ncbi:ubiquitin-related domain-containing protein [Coemansia spiralis]|nr:ubiquitin-related domain-containing protein [Coemansia spiralis]
MRITVKTLTGKQLEISVDDSLKVEDIKLKIEEKEGIPPPQQRLIVGGKQMESDQPIKKYLSNENLVIHLVLALRGGCTF